MKYPGVLEGVSIYAMLLFGLRHCSVLILLALALTACGSETESPASSITLTPTTSAKPTTDHTLNLASVLASDNESRGNDVLSHPDLLYAVKEARHVTVFRRNVITGQENIVLEYDESHEAKHSSNYWEELPPAASFEESVGTVVFIEDNGIGLARIGSGQVTSILLREPGPTFGSTGLSRSRWAGQNGADLCCAFNIAAPVMSADGARVAVLMTQWEGHSVGTFDTSGASACLIEGATTENPVWSSQGTLLVPSEGGAYGNSGLFVVHPSNPCTPAKIADTAMQSAAWSSDGSSIVAAVLNGYPETNQVTLQRLSDDGSDSQILLPEGFNYWPIFDPTDRNVFFIRRSGLSLDAEESIWRYDTQTGETAAIQDIPTGWSFRSPSWTADGYLLFRAHSNRCNYWSCSNRLVVLDSTTGRTVYVSSAHDFATHLGFLP
jgi:hypothetical protein